MTGAFGIGKAFGVVDVNWVWSNMDNFVDPVKSNVLSVRLGRAFKFKKNPQSNVAVWVGGMRVRMGNITEGTITLRDVLPDETWANRDKIVNDYYHWYDGLDDMDPRKAIADRILTPMVDNIDDANGEGTTHYKLGKNPKQEWNVIVGGQYQINKEWQIRAEGGIIRNRKSILLSANYRFGIKKRHLRKKKTKK